MQQVIDYIRRLRPNFIGVINDIEKRQQQLTALGVDWNSEPRCGLSGCYLKGRNNIIKITTDLSEYFLFKKVYELGNLSGFVKIEYLEPLDETYLIVKEAIVPLHTLLADNYYDEIATGCIDFMHVYYQELRDYELGVKQLAAAIATIKRHLTQHGPPEAKDIYESLRKLAYKGFAASDIDPDNLGLTADHRLVIFDGQLRPLQRPLRRPGK